MGPFPHDAPAPQIDATNPAGTDGFEFVEYAHPNPEELHALFRQMAGLFNALSERCGASGAVKDVFPLSERSPV